MLISYAKRFLRLTLSFFVYSIGIYCCLQANIGLAPWDAFHLGISYLTGISMGQVVMWTGVFIIGIDFLLKEQVGFGSLMNAVLIGFFLDIFIALEPFPMMTSLASGLAMLLVGLCIIAVASFLYIGSAMGCGPRDALMVALCRRFDRSPVGLIRTFLEGSALLVGWLCGAKVGIGTIVAVFGIGIIMEFLFRLLKFNVKTIEHENFVDTFRIWGLIGKKDREK